MTVIPTPKTETPLPCPLCRSANVALGVCYVEAGAKEPAVRCIDCGCRATLKAWQARCGVQTEPVAWICELAYAIDNDRQYCDWRTHLSLVPPMVPEKSIRDLRPLYASPLPSADQP